ncbi:hypothetical protein EDD18DRAFT_1357184 [Armillaria luteobubalina]|uniref:Uncharacterized protein n=1 Tax=Armillaria luteobubalina TaxID=153913 RepID=A0AA39Q071_9AGAR|nr:hypothetical protein EDD18DRAFT_1357184 [Armillaria luteobubalina]
MRNSGLKYGCDGVRMIAYEWGAIVERTTPSTAAQVDSTCAPSTRRDHRGESGSMANRNLVINREMNQSNNVNIGYCFEHSLELEHKGTGDSYRCADAQKS